MWRKKYKPWLTRSSWRLWLWHIKAVAENEQEPASYFGETRYGGFL
jgi:hypothetical protein